MRMPSKRLLGTACAALTVVAAPTSGALAPNSVSMVDCNAHSPPPSFGSNCTDPMSVYDGVPTRLQDNGQYVGHDTAAVKFYPQDACAPDSDANTGAGAAAAGSAFLELQLYPPCYQPPDWQASKRSA